MAESVAAGSEADRTTGISKRAYSLAECFESHPIKLFSARELTLSISRQLNIAFTLHHLSCTLPMNPHSAFPVAIARCLVHHRLLSFQFRLERQRDLKLLLVFLETPPTWVCYSGRCTCPVISQSQRWG